MARVFPTITTVEGSREYVVATPAALVTVMNRGESCVTVLGETLEVALEVAELGFAPLATGAVVVADVAGVAA